MSGLGPTSGESCTLSVYHSSFKAWGHEEQEGKSALGTTKIEESNDNYGGLYYIVIVLYRLH